MTSTGQKPESYKPSQRSESSERSEPDELPKAPEVSNYLDYRIYLKDFLAFKKKEVLRSNPQASYTYSTFSAACGLKAPQYLKLIIEGQRNLSKKTITQFTQALHLKKEDFFDFQLLVLSNQETEPGKRALLFKQLMDYRVQIKIKKGTLNKKQFQQIPNWATWVLFESLDTKLSHLDNKSLQQFLRNKVTLQQATEALKDLFSLNLVEETPRGLKKKRHLLEKAEEIPVEVVRALQAQFMYLALESLYQDPPTEREFGSATLALTKKEFEAIRFKLRQLRKSIQKETQVLRQSGAPGDRIYQLNIQLYPVSTDLSF
jgi:uncharacterized protein (TIGR02147 family)